MGPASSYLARSRLRLPGRIRACFGSSHPAGSLPLHFQMQVAGWGHGRCRVSEMKPRDWLWASLSRAVGRLFVSGQRLVSCRGGRYKTDRVRREITIVPRPRWAASRVFRAPHPQRQGVEARLITPPEFSIETSLGGKARWQRRGRGRRERGTGNSSQGGVRREKGIARPRHVVAAS